MVKIIRSIPQLRAWIQRNRLRRSKIGFVPTMGALHQGHLDLMIRARKLVGAKGKVVVSIFVNPTQFNQKSDLKKYPRQLLKDASMCHKVGVDLIFAPSPQTMYPKDFSTWVDETNLALPLCGATRPGHFRGVCTVVTKLFNLVQPDIAIFGQKDAQQAAAIQRMVRDLDFPIQIDIAPIVREKDGLAMSSRNQRLHGSERLVAPKIYIALKEARLLFLKGERRPPALKKAVKSSLHKIPHIQIDYVELVDATTLQTVRKASRGNLLAVALFLGKVRLIDNLFL
jgi:pantoate--beta-alanine ligase